MKKKKQTCFVYCIPIDIYNMHIAVHISNDPIYIKELENTLDAKIDENEHGAVFVPASGIPLLWLRKKPKTAEQIGTLAHEAGHISKSILTSRGMTINDKTEEAYCYLQGYIVKSILQESRKV